MPCPRNYLEGKAAFPTEIRYILVRPWFEGGAGMNSQEPERSKPQSSDDERTEKRSALLQIARYSQIAFALPAATVLGWLLGVLLDRWLHTTWIYIAGLIAGILVGFVELIRIVMSDSK